MLYQKRHSKLDVFENLIMRVVSIFALLAIFSVIDVAHAERVGKRGCMTDNFNRVYCAPAKGVIFKDAFGNAVCGKGQCIRDHFGRIICSSRKGGLAVEDDFGRVICAGGCDEASTSHCRQLK